MKRRHSCTLAALLTELLFSLTVGCSSSDDKPVKTRTEEQPAEALASDSGADKAPSMKSAAKEPSMTGADNGSADCAKFDSSFQAIQKLIFEQHGCTAAACHGAAVQGGLDLRPDVAYQHLVDAQAKGSAFARVQPGTAKESYLYLKLRAATAPGSVEIAGSPMPVALPALSERELQAIELWIQKGASEQGFAADARAKTDVGSLLDSCKQPLDATTVKPLEPPARDEGIQFLLPSYTLKAGTEVENCTQFAFDFSDQVPPEFRDEARHVIFVNGARVRQDAQSHHLVLYNNRRDLTQLTGDLSTWTCREGDHAGGSCDPRKGSADCGEHGVCADVSANGFGGGCGSLGGGSDGFSPQIANTQAPQEYIPPRDGVYWEVPLRGVLAFDSHAFNLSDQDTVLHARVNFYYTSNLQRKLVPTNVVDKISIAAGQAPFTKQTYCAKYVAPRGDSLTLLAFHTHRHGERTWVNHPTLGMIYENFVYNDPLYKKFEPWLDFDAPDDAGRTLEYCAVYNNGVAADGSPDVELVTRASRLPDRTSCKPVACVAGKIAKACSADADCDSAAGVGDGECDACPITGGVTTENEMFVLMPWLAKPAAK